MSDESNILNIEAALNEIWKEDRLDRRADADFLQNFLLRRIDERGQRGASRSYVLNLDAGWGHGKSFFLERFAMQLKEQGYVVAEVNAWRDDHAEDPLLAVIAAINDAVVPLIEANAEAQARWKGIIKAGTSVALAGAKGTAIHWLKKVMGEGVEGMIEAGADAGIGDSAKAGIDAVGGIIDKKAEKLLDNFNESRKSINDFRQNLAFFISKCEEFEAKIPVFVIVDEIDRCRPIFAISLLERIKHLFDLNDCIFIIGTNTDQLQHSINAVYGINFDSERYLHRFFDRTYKFREPSIKEFVEYLVIYYQVDSEIFRIPPTHSLSSYILGCFEFYGLGLRDCIQCFDILRSFITIWSAEPKIEIVLLIPYIVASQQGKQSSKRSDLAEDLKNIRTKNRSNAKSDCWIVKFRPRDQVNGETLFFNMAGVLDAELSNLVQRNGDISESMLWTKMGFQEEWNIRHGAINSRKQSQLSIMSTYWSLIRNIGQLS